MLAYMFVYVFVCLFVDVFIYSFVRHGKKPAPTVGSLSQMLIQAVHSQDNALMEVLIFIHFPFWVKIEVFCVQGFRGNKT